MCGNLNECQLQAVPSGSGRWDLDQPAVQSHRQGTSGRALLTAALSKMGISSIPFGKVDHSITPSGIAALVQLAASANLLGYKPHFAPAHIACC